MPRAKLRVFLDHQGVERKFFTLIVDKDNSFYVHLSRPEGQPWRFPGTGPPSGDAAGFSLDFENFVEPDFELCKVSLHPTGFIHSTDVHGKRYRDGLRGLPFDEMATPYDVCAMYPCHPSALPLYKGRGGNTIRIKIPDELGPFGAVLSIVETRSPFNDSRPTDSWTLLFAESRFSLRLSLRPVLEMVGTETPPWPPFPFFVFLHDTTRWPTAQGD